MTVMLELDAATEERIAHAAGKAGVSISDYLLGMIGPLESNRSLDPAAWMAQVMQLGMDLPTSASLPLEAIQRESIYEH